MSRLLSIATKGIIPHLAMGGFKRLARHGKNRPGAKGGYKDGWGIGYFLNGRAKVTTHIGDAFTSVRWDELTHMTGSNPEVKVLTASLRNRGRRNLDEMDGILSPFSLKDADGREWLLAFDGDVGPHKSTGDHYTHGTELAPFKLLRRILDLVKETAQPQHEGKRAALALKKAVCEIAENHHYDVLNLTLSDGHDVYLLRYVEKEEDWNRLFYIKTASAVIGCSEPLQSIEGKWEELPNHSLLIFDIHLGLQKVDF